MWEWGIDSWATILSGLERPEVGDLAFVEVFCGDEVIEDVPEISELLFFEVSLKI